MYGVHDVRVETVPDARIVEPTDALVRVTRACICGSDLWPYNSMPTSETGNRMGHEFLGVVESIGAAVRTVKKGDLVVASFAWSDGTCEFCRQGQVITETRFGDIPTVMGTKLIPTTYLINSSCESP